MILNAEGIITFISITNRKHVTIKGNEVINFSFTIGIVVLFVHTSRYPLSIFLIVQFNTTFIVIVVILLSFYDIFNEFIIASVHNLYLSFWAITFTARDKYRNNDKTAYYNQDFLF